MPFETILGRLKSRSQGSNKGQNGHIHVLSLPGA